MPERFCEFARRYRIELDKEPAAAALEDLRKRARRGTLVLLTATRDVEHCAAEVLSAALQA